MSTCGPRGKSALVSKARIDAIISGDVNKDSITERFVVEDQRGKQESALFLVAHSC